jgi:hypothetical protein
MSNHEVFPFDVIPCSKFDICFFTRQANGGLKSLEPLNLCPPSLWRARLLESLDSLSYYNSCLTKRSDYLAFLNWFLEVPAD